MLFFIVSLGLLFALAAAGALAFGPLKVDPTKLKPGQTPEMVKKKARKFGYITFFLSVIALVLLFYYFFIVMPIFT